jgi:hypothetical protein
MARLWIYAFSLLFALLGAAPSAWAGALKAVISAVESPLFDQPSENSRVKEVLKAGEPVSLNEAIRQGFYYGRTRSGSLGWIRVLDVRIVGRFEAEGAGAAKDKEKADSESQKRSKPWRLLAGYGLNGFAHTDIVAQTEPGILEAGGGTLGLELDYLIRSDWALAFKFNRLSQSLNLICTDPSLTESECTFTVGAFEALLGGRYRLPLSEMVRLELGGFAGFAFAGSVKAQEAGGGYSEISGSGFSAHLDLGVEIELSRKISLFGQVGYHLLKGAQSVPQFNTSTIPPDSALFEDPAALDLTGLAVMFGVGFRLPWK